MAVPKDYTSFKSRENPYVVMRLGKPGERFGKVRVGVALVWI